MMSDERDLKLSGVFFQVEKSVKKVRFLLVYRLTAQAQRFLYTTAVDPGYTGK